MAVPLLKTPLRKTPKKVITDTFYRMDWIVFMSYPVIKTNFFDWTMDSTRQIFSTSAAISKLSNLKFPVPPLY